MKWLIDENLPPSLTKILRVAGIAAHHVNELKSHNKQQIKDDQLRKLTMQKGYLIITKDDDFVKSYVDRKVPEKMIFVYGLQEKEQLLTRMGEIAHLLPKLTETHDFIEITEKEIRFPLSN